MRKALVVSAGLLALALGTGSKYAKLESYEKDHYDALKVWFEDSKKESKAYFKLKTPAERDQWLKDKGYWDRYYQYEEHERQEILSREPKVGWTQDMVYMAWGPPFAKLKSTKRTAETSVVLVYRMEVTKDGEHMVWAPGSKETYKAIRQYQAELMVDNHRVTDIVQKDAWTQ